MKFFRLHNATIGTKQTVGFDRTPKLIFSALPDSSLCKIAFQGLVNGKSCYLNLYYFFAAFALKCNVCSSSTSLDDCDKNKKEMDCGAAYDRCATFSVDFKVSNIETKSYMRTCNTKAYCDAAQSALKACKDAKGSCELECCEKDLCNGGTAPLVSVFLMVACALVTFFR